MVVKQKGQLVDGYRCDNCGHLFTEPGEAQYECSRCGGTQVEDKRCASCNIFMAKVADETCPECEDGQDIHKVELFEAPEGELWTDEQSFKNYVKETPKRKKREKAAKLAVQKELDAYRKKREERDELKWKLLQQALPALKRHMPNLVKDWELTEERWRLDMFLASNSLCLNDPIEFLQAMVQLNNMEEKHGV